MSLSRTKRNGNLFSTPIPPVQPVLFDASPAIAVIRADRSSPPLGSLIPGGGGAARGRWDGAVGRRRRKEEAHCVIGATAVTASRSSRRGGSSSIPERGRRPPVRSLRSAAACAAQTEESPLPNGPPRPRWWCPEPGSSRRQASAAEVIGARFLAAAPPGDPSAAGSGPLLDDWAAIALATSGAPRPRRDTHTSPGGNDVLHVPCSTSCCCDARGLSLWISPGALNSAVTTA